MPQDGVYAEELKDAYIMMSSFNQLGLSAQMFVRGLYDRAWTEACLEEEAQRGYAALRRSPAYLDDHLRNQIHLAVEKKHQDHPWNESAKSFDGLSMGEYASAREKVVKAFVRHTVPLAAMMRNGASRWAHFSENVRAPLEVLVA